MPDGREKFSLPEFIENFDLGRVDPTGPVFDVQKLEWLNGEWIRSLPSKEIAERIKEYTKVSISNVEKVLPLIQERLKKLSEFDQLTAYFFKGAVELEKKQIVPKKHDLATTIDMLRKVEKSLAATKNWDKATIEQILNKITDDLGWSKTDLFQTVRYVETASRATPPLPETLEVVGKEKILRRIRNAVKLLSQ
jgi:glutamyl-tRNA synthetase